MGTRGGGWGSGSHREKVEGGGALGLHWEQVGEGSRCQGEGMGRIGNKEGEGRGVGIALGKEGKGGGSHWEKRGRWGGDVNFDTRVYTMHI